MSPALTGLLAVALAGLVMAVLVIVVYRMAGKP